MGQRLVWYDRSTGVLNRQVTGQSGVASGHDKTNGRHRGLLGEHTTKSIASLRAAQYFCFLFILFRSRLLKGQHEKILLSRRQMIVVTHDHSFHHIKATRQPHTLPNGNPYSNVTTNSNAKHSLISRKRFQSFCAYLYSLV